MLERLCELYGQAYGVRVGVTTMHFTLKRMGLTYKKKTFHDPKQSEDGANGIKLPVGRGKARKPPLPG